MAGEVDEETVTFLQLFGPQPLKALGPERGVQCVFVQQGKYVLFFHIPTAGGL